MYDELVKRLNEFRLKEDEYQIIPVYVSEIIGKAADAIEEWNNIKEQKYGKWINPADPICYQCSICGNYVNQKYGLFNEPVFWNYCPNCGKRITIIESEEEE